MMARSLVRFSSTWYRRQVNDPFVKKAKADGYRARSAYKLIEIDSHFKLLKPGSAVVECGCAPGAWTQVSVARINAKGFENPRRPAGVHVGCDLLFTEPVRGADVLNCSDVTSPTTQSRILELLGDRKPQVVLSDIALNASGVKELDADGLFNLLYHVLRFSVLHSEIGASFVCKTFKSKYSDTFAKDLEKFYRQVKEFKPKSSRSESPEMYFVAKAFRGIEKQ